jgi:N-acetylneuraminic acid mutarotase
MKEYSLLILIFFAGLFSSCDQSEPSPYNDIEFEELSQHPNGGRSTAVSFVIGDTAYLALGRKSLFKNSLNDCWAYYPETDQWSQKKDFPGKARVNASAEVVNNKAYVGLGYFTDEGIYSDSTYFNDWWMYDATTDSWTEKASMPIIATDKTPFTSGCVSFVYNEQIYIGAGFNGYSFSSRFWKYDPATDIWTQLNDFNGPSRAIATATSNSSRSFFGSGYNTNTLNDWWEYLPETDSWEAKKEFPDRGRVNALSFSVNARIFVATGRRFGGDLTTGKLYSDILEYDTQKDAWYRRGNIPNGNRENAVSFVIKNKAYIGFGEDNDKIFNDLWCFEIN